LGLGLAQTCPDFFRQGNWVWKWIDNDCPVSNQIIGSGKNPRLKSCGHISPAAGLLSFSAIQIQHCWIWMTWGYRWCRKWIKDCGRTGGNCRCITVLANAYWGRCSVSGVTNPRARTLGIPRGDYQYRALRAKELTQNWSQRSPGRLMIRIVPMLAQLVLLLTLLALLTLAIISLIFPIIRVQTLIC